MKKLLTISLILSIGLTFSACESSNEAIDVSSNSSITSSAVSSESTVVITESSEPTSKNDETSSTSMKPSSKTPSSKSSQSDVASKIVSSSISSAPTTVKITFPEGSTVARIFDTLEAKGVAKKDDLFSVMQSYDFSSYPLISSSPNSTERCFKLEGYLYPNTYEFYVGESPENIIKRFLTVSEKKINQEYRSRASELGYSIDDMIILASILEKEVHKSSELATVSSIFHNRLKAGQKLQSDATIKYVEGAIKPYITGDINRYNSFYNTYKCKALPAGAICNPSIKAIEAALYPAETNYFYFANDNAGNYYYATTYEEHLANYETIKVNNGE